MKRIFPLILLLLIQVVGKSQEYISAQPVGGKQQLHYFINQELTYPSQMYEKGIEGSVIFHFTVDDKGLTSNISGIESPDPLALDEALRIFRLIEWVPATFRGVPTSETKIFEVEFNIKKYTRLTKSRGYSIIYNPFEPIDTTGKIYWYSTLDAAPHPIFAQKNQNLANFIGENLVYPDIALKQNVTGIVKISFVVETNGNISNMSIVNSVGAGCNEEAIRILRLLKWMPGIHNMKAVRTRTSLTINFNLDRGKDGIFNPTVKSSYGG